MEPPTDVTERTARHLRRERRLAVLQNLGLLVIALGVAVLVYIAVTRG